MRIIPANPLASFDAKNELGSSKRPFFLLFSALLASAMVACGGSPAEPRESSMGSTEGGDEVAPGEHEEVVGTDSGEPPRSPLDPPADAPSQGASDATLTVQVFSDFECPFCGTVRPTIDRLLQAYDGRVRVVWRNLPLPFHPKARVAAEAAMEVHAQAGDEAFWAYHDLLFDNQKQLGREDLERYAETIRGVDLTKFRRALDEEIHRPRVDEDARVLRDAGFPLATPSFLVGPLLIQGAQPYAVFAEAIEAVLEALGP